MAAQNTYVEEKYKVGNDYATRRYIKGKFLGKGGFAKCWEFVNAETEYVHAAKIIQKSSLTKSRAKQKLMSEIKIHRSIKHVNVCQF
jgi:polo-like kinase 1